MYFGSGSAIARALKKYGKENFKRETLAEFTTETEVLAEEAKIVDTAWVKSNDNYNMTLGGGKPPDQTGFKMPQYAKEKISEASKKRSLILAKTAKETMNIRMQNGGWTSEEIKNRVITRRNGVGYPNEMNACNTDEAIKKRVETRRANGNYSTNTSNLHTPEVTFKRTKTRIINQMKKGKAFNEEALLKYGITSEDTQDILQQS
jgi:hypothetical protein